MGPKQLPVMGGWAAVRKVAGQSGGSPGAPFVLIFSWPVFEDR